MLACATQMESPFSSLDRHLLKSLGWLAGWLVHLTIQVGGSNVGSPEDAAERSDKVEWLVKNNKLLASGKSALEGSHICSVIRVGHASLFLACSLVHPHRMS